MIEVNIKYHVADKEGRTFRPIGDIAKDVEREMWDSLLFSEAQYYQIEVKNETEQTHIEFIKRRKKNECC